MEKRLQKPLYAAFFLLIFLFLFLWFFRIHPLIPFNGDDWTYLSYVRLATPIWGAWNPAKVFPEIVFPFFSTIAAFVLTPLTGDYITAQTLMHALVVSAAITGYLYCFARLMRQVFSFTRVTASVLTTLFFSLHFLVLRTAKQDNLYLFCCTDLNCYYNYLLPMLLNASIVMLLVADEKLETFFMAARPEIKGLLLILVYLAIFSNLPASGILAAYAGARVLLSLIRQGKRLKLRPFLVENSLYLGILAAWLVSAVFELNGGRADGSPLAHVSLLKQLRMTCYLLKNVVLGSNRLFLISSGIVGAAAVVCMLLDGGIRSLNAKLASVLGALLIATAALFVYTILLCAAVGPIKIICSEYLFAIYVPIFLFVLLALGYLLARFPRLMLVLPLLTLFLISSINTSGNTFRESNVFGLSAEKCGSLSRFIVEQFQTADAAGQREMELHVPQFAIDPETEDNWPYTLFLMDRISDTLYSHGITSRLIDITPVVDPSVNELFHIPLPSK